MKLASLYPIFFDLKAYIRLRVALDQIKAKLEVLGVDPKLISALVNSATACQRAAFVDQIDDEDVIGVPSEHLDRYERRKADIERALR